LPAVAGLAIAIGSTTAVFSVFSAMLIRPIGFQSPGRLVTIWRSNWRLRWSITPFGRYFSGLSFL
jgi:hypothetical protein